MGEAKRVLVQRGEEPSEVEQKVRWVGESLAWAFEFLGVEGGPGEIAMIDDLLQVVDRRGVRRVFDGFQEEDLWQLAAATRVGAERVYPQVETFSHELRAELADGFDFVGNQGISARRSHAFAQPGLWGTTHLWLSFWPHGITRPKDANNAQQIVQFNFYDVKMIVGIRYIFRRHASTQQKWKSSVQEIAAGIATLPRTTRSLPRLYEITEQCGRAERMNLTGPS